MPTVCMECALEAFVASDGLSIFEDGPVAVFEEGPWEHMKRAHPDGIDIARRKELEEKAHKIATRLKTFSANALNN